MQEPKHLITYLFCLGTLFVSFYASAVNAACSPGIPCTGYDAYSNPFASNNPAWNGLKTGVPVPNGLNLTGATVTACDGNFMNQIFSRAYMEASREVLD